MGVAALNIVCVCLLTLAVFAIPASGKPTFYVAPTGNDSNTGTRSKPFATLERARKAVRSAGTSAKREIIVRGGAYEMRSAFTLGAEDSGTATNPVIWRATSWR